MGDVFSLNVILKVGFSYHIVNPAIRIICFMFCILNKYFYKLKWPKQNSNRALDSFNGHALSRSLNSKKNI